MQFGDVRIALLDRLVARVGLGVEAVFVRIDAKAPLPVRGVEGGCGRSADLGAQGFDAFDSACLAHLRSGRCGQLRRGELYRQCRQQSPHLPLRRAEQPPSAFVLQREQVPPAEATAEVERRASRFQLSSPDMMNLNGRHGSEQNAGPSPAGRRGRAPGSPATTSVRNGPTLINRDHRKSRDCFVYLYPSETVHILRLACEFPVRQQFVDLCLKMNHIGFIHYDGVRTCFLHFRR